MLLQLLLQLLPSLSDWSVTYVWTASLQVRFLHRNGWFDAFSKVSLDFIYSILLSYFALSVLIFSFHSCTSKIFNLFFFLFMHLSLSIVYSFFQSLPCLISIDSYFVFFYSLFLHILMQDPWFLWFHWSVLFYYFFCSIILIPPWILFSFSCIFLYFLYFSYF